MYATKGKWSKFDTFMVFLTLWFFYELGQKIGTDGLF